jgi:mediator of RNA polymerase II transcription subunit 18
MYEYSLFGQVNESRQTQLLQVLAGISAMQPHIVRERHLIFRPTRPPTRAVAQVGGSQAIQDTAKLAARQNQNAATDVYFMRLVEDLESSKTSQDQDVKPKQPNSTTDDDNVQMVNGIDHEDDVPDTSSTTPQDEAQPPASKWRMVFHDVPEPGKRPVTARMLNITEISDGDAVGFMEGMGYTFVYQ